MDVTPQLLKEVEFREKFRGYDPDEVDDFLERVGVALAQLHERLRESETHIETANARAARSEARVRDNSDMDETLRRTLVLAQRTADAAIKEAEEQAAAIVGEAQTKARQQLATADERSQQSIAGADSEAKRRLAGADEQAQRVVIEAQTQADQTVASAREQANRLLMDARHQAEEIVSQARSSADVVAEERRQQLLKDVADLEARREAVGRNASVLDAHLAKQRERLQGLSTDIAALIDRGDRLGDLAPPELVPEPSVDVRDEPQPAEAESAPTAAAVALPPAPQVEPPSPGPTSEPAEPVPAEEPAAATTPAEHMAAPASPFRSRANAGRVAPPLSPPGSAPADDAGPPTEQIDMGDLLAGPPTPEPEPVAESLDHSTEEALPAENLDDTSPTPVPVDVGEPVPAPPPAFRPEVEAAVPPPPPPPAGHGAERSHSEGPGEPPQPPPPPRSPLVPRSVTQAAVAAAGEGVDKIVPDAVADGQGALAARVRSAAAPTPPPPARESFVDELRRAIGDDGPDASEDTEFFAGADPSDGTEGLFEEGSDKARSWFGRRG